MLKKVINREGQEIFVCDLKQIQKHGAQYNMLISGRSDGKSFAVLEEILYNKLNLGKQGMIIRRWQEDFLRGRAKTMWNNLVVEGKLEGTGWDSIIYKENCWWLAKKDPKTKSYKYDTDPLCYAMALIDVEHGKSTSYPDVTTILFDEFIPMGSYIPDEFVKFMNTVSTVTRKYRTDVKIYMCANTINWDCLYFREMGIKHVRDMKSGTISVYKYGDSRMKVALEYLPQAPNQANTNADMYFAFDNPKLAMIRGEGFEIGMYPHLPEWVEIKPKNIKKIFIIDYNDTYIQGEVVQLDGNRFLYFHKKTTPIKDENKDIIFSEDCDPRRNWRTNLLGNYDQLGKIINDCFRREKVFYQDNQIGEDIQNYLTFSRQLRII